MSGSVDSLYPQPPAANAAPNFSAQVGQTLQLLQGLNANTEFQQKQAAQSAFGKIFQDAQDPKTGAVDVTKAIQGIVMHPATSRYAPELLSSLTSTGQVQASTLKTALDTAKTRMDGVSELLAPLNALGPNVQQKDLVPALARGVGLGIFDADTAQRMLSTMPPGGPALQQQLQQIGLQNANGRQTLAGIIGKQGLTNVGGQQVPTTEGSLLPQNVPGAIPGAASVANTPTPEAINRPQTVTDASGSQTVKPAAETQNFYDGSGKLISSGGNLTVTPAAADAYIGQKYPIELAQRVQQAPIQISLLKRNLDLLKAFNPGAGAPAFTDIAAKLEALGVSKQTIADFAGKVDPVTGKSDPVAAAQEFAKNSFLINSQTLLSIVGKNNLTDDKFSQAQQALPTIGTNPRAAENIFNYFKKIAELPQRESAGFQAYQDLNKKNPAKYPLSAWPSVYAHKLQQSGILDTPVPGAVK